MFNNDKESYNEKMKRRADILYPTMKDKKINKPKNLPLGKSVYDDDEGTSIKKLPKVKGELEPLVRDIEKEKTTEHKSRKERTIDEQEKFLEDFYPSMAKNKENDKTEANTKNEKEDKKGNFTGAAADIKKSKLTDNNEENEKNRESLKFLEMDDNEYQIKGNTISKKEKTRDYEIINGIKYPKNTDNQKVQEMKNEALKQCDENDKSKRDKYLKSISSKPFQFGVDNVDNSIVKEIARVYSGKEASENLYMSKTNSYLNTDYAKKHKVYNNYKEAPNELQEYLKGKISKQIGEDKLESTKGIYIDKNSETSKNLSDNLIENKDFIKKLNDYENAMNHNYSVDDSISLKGINWHNAIGNADIKKMHINKNGDVELYVTDTYDFNKNEKSGLPAIGRDRQEKGEITPYFAVYHVIIPKEKYDKIRYGK